MYNDYYLQQINDKLNTTNDYLETVIQQNQSIISGDNIIISNQHSAYFLHATCCIWILVFLSAILFYHVYHTFFVHKG